MDVNINVDIAYLSSQTPPINVFPTPNTSHLPYNEQIALLESDYTTYYEYRGDLKYCAKMARKIQKTKPTKPKKRLSKNAEEIENTEKEEEEKDELRLLAGRICRDKKNFFGTRIHDDNIILERILDAMIEENAAMEEYLENILIKNGELELPNWDEMFGWISGQTLTDVVPESVVKPQEKSTAKKGKVPKARKVSATLRKLDGKVRKAKSQTIVIKKRKLTPIAEYID